MGTSSKHDGLCIAMLVYQRVIIMEFCWDGRVARVFVWFFFGHQPTQETDHFLTFWDHIALPFLRLKKQNC